MRSSLAGRGVRQPPLSRWPDKSLLHDVKDASGSRRIRNSVKGRKNAPHPASDRNGGARRDRTDDLLLAKQALSQLSYGPALNRRIRSNTESGPTHDEGQRGRSTSGSRSTRPSRMVGLGRLELPTSRLSGVRSNHLSYRPEGSRTHVRPERKRNEDGGIPPDGA
jgi:hypothetical protein